MKKFVGLLFAIAALAVPTAANASRPIQGSLADPGGGMLPACTSALEGYTATISDPYEGHYQRWLCTGGRWVLVYIA